jgi:methylenetetrahydrofolate reductase (NADPH)
LIAGAPGIHFYALNRAPATRAVLGALKASKPWERTRGDAGALAGRIS